MNDEPLNEPASVQALPSSGSATRRALPRVTASPVTVLGALFALAVLGCNGNGTDGSGGGNSGGAGNGTGTAQNGTGSSQGGSGSGTQSGGTFSSGTASDGTTTGVGGGCATTTQQAQKIPLDMYIMLDQSGSMDSSVGAGMTRWTAVTGALTQFLQQSNAAGLGVGVQFFGLGAPGAFNDSCTASDYANPLSTDANGLAGVEIGTLPGNAAALIASIGAHTPNTLTPTSAALQGAVDHAAAWQQAHPTHVVVAVLATDGDPTECDTSLANIDAIAATALAGPQKIKTFVIGVGSSLTNLNGIAAAGGTGQAFIVDTNPQASQQFLAALNAIQGTALACNYIIPPPPPPQVADFTKLNVQYTPGGGGMAMLIPKVADAAACPPTGDAWYYDNNAAPTQVVFCPSTCNTLKADTMGSVEIVLGCQTVLN
jgi:hypothetical protein